MNFHLVFVARNVLLLTALIAAAPLSARANVYASNVKLNGTAASVQSPQGRQVQISYVLNENATAGVTLDILSGTNLVRSLRLEDGAPGTARGQNTVAWDGRDSAGALVPEATYGLRITAAAQGHAGWTLISEDHRTNHYVFRGTGIAVNQNSNSPYYGRVYVANADSGPNAGFPGAKPGEFNGVLQFNADGSPAEEGVLAVGEGWSGFGESPWRVEVTRGERVFANDLFYGGEVFSWDATFAPTSKVEVLKAGSFPSAAAKFGGLAIAERPDAGLLYVADSAEPSTGIWRYPLDANGQVPAGNTGELVVAVTNLPNSLDVAPYDLAMDSAGGLYAIQYRFTAGDPSPRVLKFQMPPLGDTNLPLTEAVWAVGQGDDTMGRASGIAVDPSGQWVAVAVRGINGPEFEWLNGGTYILASSNGIVITNLDLNVEIGGETAHQDTDVSWDALGNVYLIDDYAQLWRSYSPPGSNQSTTAAPWQIQIIPGVITQQPEISGITLTGTNVMIRFTGSVGVPPTSFTLLGSPSAVGPYVVVANASITAGSGPGEYVATVPAGTSNAFYRISEGEAPPPGAEPVITGISMDAAVVTVRFTGAASDISSMFSLLSSATADGAYAPTAGASIAQGESAGQFRATVPASGPTQFYRIQK